MRGIWRALIGLLSALCIASPTAAQENPAPFSGWATAIVAADWRDSAGTPIEAFDNSLRDLPTAFARAGLPVEGMTAIPLRPDAPGALAPVAALRRIGETTAANPAGCLLYFTSHGSPGVLVFGDAELTPDRLVPLVRAWCGARPTIIVLSACYSGSFIDSLKAPNRMILTAASRDRPSFGCGAGEQYPWFDACILESLPEARDFLALAAAARTCVARRETEAEFPSSNPQLFVGAELQLRLPGLRFYSPAS